jgi:outer membrane protein assembly factor BamB
MPDETRHALAITSVGDSVFFTAADGRIVCLDAASGAKRWEFLTGGLVSCTANYYKGRVYVGSDDGYAYCLDADTGKLVWRHKAVEQDRWFVSYGWLSSMWPIRTDVLVDEGVAYFGSGVFPHDGMFINAVDANTGRRMWQTTCSQFGIGGYIVASHARLYLPVEAKGFGINPTFRRVDGGGDAHSPDDEVELYRQYKNAAGVVHNGIRYLGERATDLKKEEERARDMHVWDKWKTIPGRFPDVSTVVYAGGIIFYLTHDTAMWDGKYPSRHRGGAVIARDAETGDVLWSFDFPERPYQLVVANGSLLVSTLDGTIYGFASKDAGSHGIVNEPIEPEPFERTDAFNQAAGAVHRTKEISGLSAGYAVVLDCDSGALPVELVRQTDLYACAVFDDEAKAAAARMKYARAGVHASRICVWYRDPNSPLPFPAKFADVVLSEKAAANGRLPMDVDEIHRLVKPIRGVALIGGGKSDAAIKAWIGEANQNMRESNLWKYVERNGTHWAMLVRPPVPDGGGWAGPRGGPGNTNNSHDAALEGPLGVVWYGAPSVKHSMDYPPLIVNGVMVCPIDLDTIEAYDQYNGRLLWKYTDKGIGLSASRSGTAGGNHMYFNHAGRCLRFDLYEGGFPVKIATPFRGAHWELVTVSRDGRTLWGVAREHDEKQQMVWSAIFAIDTESDRVLWKLGGPDEIAEARTAGQTTVRQWHHWNAISDGRMYIIGPVNDQTCQQAVDETRAYLAEHDHARVKEFNQQVAANQRGFHTLTAIDAQTGTHLYDHGIDITNCAGFFAAHNGFVISGSTHGSKNVIGGSNSAVLTVWDGATGRLVWNQSSGHSFMPVVADRAIYAEPWVYELKTGKRVKRMHPVTGKAADVCWARKGKHCGGYNGSEHFLFGRNMGVGYYDTQRDDGMYTFWHSRIACTNDVGTGGGMMIKPPYAIGCRCAWSQPFTVALAQVDQEPEASFEMAQPSDAMPVKHVRLNFGAEGERRDGDGNLWIRPGRNRFGHFSHVEFVYGPTWLSYPRVDHYHASVNRSNVHTQIEGTDLDFVFASGARGIRRCVIPLSRPQDGKATYSVRLGFCALPHDRPGQRVFDIRVNGKALVEKFDAVAATGGPDRAVWREFTVEGEHQAVIDFVAANSSPTLDEAPILNAVEVIRQKVLAPGISVPHDTWLNARRRQKRVQLTFTNQDMTTVNGQLRFKAPQGLTIKGPTERAIVLAGVGAQVMEVQLMATEEAVEGTHVISVKLLDANSRLLNEAPMNVDYLGPLERRSITLAGNATGSQPPQGYEMFLMPGRRYQWLSVLGNAEGKTDPPGQVTYLGLSLPQDIRQQIRRARVQLRIWSDVTHAINGATPGRRAVEPEESDLGTLRTVAGPPWPRPDAINHTNMPELTGAESKLRFVAGSKHIVWADLTDRLSVFDTQGQQVIALEPSGPNGTAYYNNRSPHPAYAPQLILDYLSEPVTTAAQ